MAVEDDIRAAGGLSRRRSALRGYRCHGGLGGYPVGPDPAGQSGRPADDDGRPVLVVPSAGAPLNLDRAVVAWKESRQARRAVVDALPLLRQASHVAVATIAAAEVVATARSCVADVIGWLKQHGIKAVPVVARPNGDDAAQLQGIARDHDAGVIVAGAFGHSRLRDWALGGVTRHLLLRGQGCALLSH